MTLNKTLLLPFFIFFSIVQVNAQKQFKDNKKIENEFNNSNPIAFVDFKIRPAFSETAVLVKPTNYINSYEISYDDAIMLNFEKERTDASKASLKIIAYIEKKNSTVIPLTVFGYSLVKSKTRPAYVFNELLNVPEDNTHISINNLYDLYIIPNVDNGLLSTEIDLSKENDYLEKGDKVVVIVTNTAAGDIGFTYEFIVKNAKDEPQTNK